jgi:hypothetical protein
MTKTTKDTEAAPAAEVAGVVQEDGHVFYPPTEATQPLDPNAPEIHSQAEAE